MSNDQILMLPATEITSLVQGGTLGVILPATHSAVSGFEALTLRLCAGHYFSRKSPAAMYEILDGGTPM